MQTLTIWTTYDFTTLRWDNTSSPLLPSDLSGLEFKTYLPTGGACSSLPKQTSTEDTDATQCESCEPMEALTLGAASETMEREQRHTERLNGSESRYGKAS